MRCLWLVIALFHVMYLSGCANKNKVERSDFGEIQPGCSRVNPSVENEVVRAAERYFIANAGVSVTKISVGQISSCRDKFIVPILASTEQVPTSRVWYVDVAQKGLVPQRLLRPM